MSSLPTIVKFTDNELHKNSFASFDLLRHQGKLCDVTVLSDSHRYAAHKIVLAATIPFFNAMFLSTMSESDKTEVSVLGINSRALEAFINFAYTGSIQITPSNVQTLLMGANYLQLTTIRDICCKYIEDRLSPLIVLTVRSFAQILLCTNLVTACTRYIYEHFEAVALTDSFLLLDADELLVLLESDELVVASEESLFYIIMRWVEYDRTTRTDQMTFDGDHDDDIVYRKDSIKSLLATGANEQPRTREPDCQSTSHLAGGSRFLGSRCHEAPQLSSSEPCIPQIKIPPGHVEDEIRKPCTARLTMLSELLRRIRLPLISASFISGVISKHPLIRANMQCRDLLDEVRDLLLLRTCAPCSFSCRPRRGQEVFGIIYAIGGLTETGDCHGIVETYHPSIGRWELAEHMPSNRSRVGIVAMNGLLYAIGGFDGSTRLKMTEFYNPKTKTWRSAAPMNHKRSALGAAALDGCIYVCGGYDGTASLRTCEVYNPEADRWYLIPSMTEPRSACGLVALGNGCLYAVGGHNGLVIYSSVECYNRRTGVAGNLVSTSPSGTAAHLTSEADSLNAGGDGFVQRGGQSTSVAWHPVARMKYRRCRHGLTVFRNRVIVAGGYNGVAFLRSVEIFDPAAGPLGQWTEITPMAIPRSRVGLAFTGGLLYAIGGFDGTNHLRSVEVLQPPAANDQPVHENRSVPPPRTERVSFVESQASRTVPTHTVGSDDENSDEDLGGTLSPFANPTMWLSDFDHLAAVVSTRMPTNTQLADKVNYDPGLISNWRWTTGASLIAHEGWVGIGVLPLEEDIPPDNDSRSTIPRSRNSIATNSCSTVERCRHFDTRRVC